MKLKNLILAGIIGFAFFTATYATEKFEIVPLYGIKVKYEGLTYKSIELKTHDAGVVVDNRIPQNVKFAIEIKQPQGFKDSAGIVSYGLRFQLFNKKGNLLSFSPDIFNGEGVQQSDLLESVNLSLTFDENTAPGSELRIKGRVYDKRDTLRYIDLEYVLTVIAASKRLPTRSLTYVNRDTRGMNSNSVGLHFNFFEFKGVEGNHFIYKVKPLSPIQFSLRGLDGWKVVDGKVNPIAEVIILDKDGLELEKMVEVVASSMSAERKEVEFKVKPTTISESGAQYFIWLKLKDANNEKAALDVVIKVYTE